MKSKFLVATTQTTKSYSGNDPIYGPNTTQVVENVITPLKDFTNIEAAMKFSATKPHSIIIPYFTVH
ncbi:hypothetical protein M1M30_gp185 [Maribacter phage Colly_1]|uniref:Uncharacterized protein n=1 Tax=Maribacter phage Colly_1 TaxID=2745691 RepID=A0A8E4XZR2_9CAUD|nr:hypothetical protein M1M30_gp185 [Maribacter phage Colly_1]QQO97290.1 hypothetical protein Colly1_185 [Maribacter phage Colly_1]